MVRIHRKPTWRWLLSARKQVARGEASGRVAAETNGPLRGSRTAHDRTNRPRQAFIGTDSTVDGPIWCGETTQRDQRRQARYSSPHTGYVF